VRSAGDKSAGVMVGARSYRSARSCSVASSARLALPVVSIPPLASCRQSGLQATEYTSLECPCGRAGARRVSKIQSRSGTARRTEARL
jgi:hypothetical protein